MDSRDLEHRRALEALYLAHERGLFNAAYRYTWSRDEARDVVQDAFVRLWRKRDGVDWPRASGLAYRMVLGLAANRRRASRIRSALGFGSTSSEEARSESRAPAPGPSSDAQLDTARLDAAVRRAIDALPERLRSVLVMTTYSDLDYAAIGASLGIPAGTVGSRRNEAIAKIRAMLDEVPRG